jgi:uncharacterized membrane protein
MNGTNSLRTVEPLAAVRKHPRAAILGAAVTAIACGAMGGVLGGVGAGLMMAVVGAIIGAPGAAHLAEDAEDRERPL